MGNVWRHLQAPLKTGAGTQAKQAPKEGRGQRQRRKKREGAGSPGQSAGQQQAITGAQSSQAAGRSWASTDNGAAGVGAGQERPPKKMRPTLEDAGKLILTTQVSMMTCCIMFPACLRLHVLDKTSLFTELQCAFRS